MALATSAALPIDGDGQLVIPVSLSALWTWAISEGRVATADNSGSSITNPTTMITAATQRILLRRSRAGTTLLLRLAYSAGATVSTSPVVEVFGRTGTNAWQRLENKSGAVAVTLTAAADDVTDGTLKYTHPSMTTHAFDCAGCDEILVGVKTAFAVSAGVTTNAEVQAKII